jgi:diguanylate cyclase (GGDEF)-like protein/PAS domain S-box-containing protein
MRKTILIAVGLAFFISFIFVLIMLKTRSVVTGDVDFGIVMFFSMAAILTLSMSFFIFRVAIRPIQEVSNLLHLIDIESDKTLKPPLEHEADEIGYLVRDVNELLSRVRTGLENEHELAYQRMLTEKLRLPATIFEEISPNGIIVTDRENHIIRVNSAFTRITGYTEEELAGKNPSILASGRHDQVFYEQLWKKLKTYGRWTGEMWDRCKDGHVKPGWFSISEVRTEDGQIANYVAIFTDISERKSIEDRLEYLSHHDALTQLPNRSLARKRFLFALTSTKWDKRGSIVMLRLDLDGFKYVNDNFGYEVGDRLLLMVANKLKNSVRGSDTVSRQSGDEFLILLSEIRDVNVAPRVSGEILESLADPFEIDGHTINITASIGFACYPQDGGDFDTLLRNADIAMYAAKRAGKNTYRHFDKCLDVDELEKLRLRADLANAIENNEIYVVFQPQLDIATNRIIGAEVLCRWTHPDRGPISPARFIPIAEESGLIGRLGEWVLRQACTRAKNWFDSGVQPFIVAVNVSAKQIENGGFVGTVSRVLEETGFPAEYLELERTESGLFANIKSAINIINDLKGLGVRLSIDDFGTGYSSLSYLQQFKVDKLKIDQSFVQNINEESAIVRAIIQMAQDLKMSVIAEGVETRDQKDILTRLGCHEIQGYLISKPLLPAEYKDFLVKWNQDSFQKVISIT